MTSKQNSKEMTINQLINNMRGDNIPWEDIKNKETSNEEELKKSLDDLAKSLYIGEITPNEWRECVLKAQNYEENGVPTHIIDKPFISDTEDADYKLDTDPGSAWSSYRNVLLKKQFPKESINEIESSSFRILKKLSLDTRESGPVKGLVIGNVQSGKTANMAAIISMAADQGWNLFVVFSGTIENLRIQNQDRLIEDLKYATKVVWKPIDNVVNSPHYIDRISNLSLSDLSNSKHLMVCLKNSTRIKNLLTWLDGDTKARENLKILFIDDEADQAGINTKKKSNIQNENDIERTAINKLFTHFLTNKNAHGKTVETSFKSLNYIAYTATPYANILNEKPGPKSLYPQNFIACLSNNNSYFGPQQIFGLDGTNLDGLNIINYISIDDIKEINGQNDEQAPHLPQSLKDAILWFYCCFAIQKLKNIYNPVSMLIHISQRQYQHEMISYCIKGWIDSLDKITFSKMCEKVYNQQTKQFTLDDFFANYKDYAYKEVDDYPPFQKIAQTLIDIFSVKIDYIKIDEDKVCTFSKGVSLCVDNCSHNIEKDKNEHIRLIYPQKNIDFTTGFIVIGGATLSRGLTIEGLVSSYFLRTIRQADTLMQMGRWFGYRKGYELLPRIWLTERTKEQFEFLSTLDFELRSEMKYIENNELSPSTVGIKIKCNPKCNFLQITAKNKQKDAITVDNDFGGVAAQTTVFYKDEEKIKANFISTSEFLNSLDDGDIISNNPNYLNSHIWRNVNNDDVLTYISKMEFPTATNCFFDLKLFKKRYYKLSEDKILTGRNVLLAGVNNDKDENDFVDMGSIKACKVVRSKKRPKNYDDKYIRIGALRNIKDYYADIDINNPAYSQEDKKIINALSTKDFRMIRKKGGMEHTSLLIIYVIDHNSKAKENDNNRCDLNIQTDLIGLSILIPDCGNATDSNYVAMDLSDYDNDINKADIDYED